MAEELLVGKCYRLGRKLGGGAFGEIFLGKHIETGERVAIKLEPLSTKHRQLPFEARIYTLLRGGGAREARAARCEPR